MKKQHIYMAYYKESKQKYFYLQNPVELNFPAIINIEETIFTGEEKSYYILRGKSGTWDKKIISGLIKAFWGAQWYYGEHLVGGVQNFFLLKANTNWDFIQLYYFPGFNLKGKARDQFTYQFLDEIKKAGN